MRSKKIAIALVMVMILSSFTFAFAGEYDFEGKSVGQLKQLLRNEQAEAEPNDDYIEALEECIEELQGLEEEEGEEEEGDDAYDFLEGIDDLEELQDLLDDADDVGDFKIRHRMEIVEKHQFQQQWEADMDELEEEKVAAEEAKDDAEEAYEEAYEDALEDGTLSEEELEELEELRLAFEEAKEAFFEIKEEFKELIQIQRLQIQNQYTAEEKKALKDAEKAIKKSNPDDTIIPYDSIFAHGYDFKFDTPPVIRSGRTLIPIRAITEGFGAIVEWDEGTQTVTITKDGDVIELVLGSNESTVNGEIVVIDTHANVMNNRTYVPLRFVLETFGLKVNWDADTEPIEVEDEEDDE